MKINRAIMILFLILVILNAADVMTTMIGLHLGAVEDNPTMMFLMVRMGVIEALLFKFFAILLIGFLAVIAQAYSQIHPLIFITAFLFSIAFMIPLVYDNLQVIWSLIT